LKSGRWFYFDFIFDTLEKYLNSFWNFHSKYAHSKSRDHWLRRKIFQKLFPSDFVTGGHSNNTQHFFWLILDSLMWHLVTLSHIPPQEPPCECSSVFFKHSFLWSNFAKNVTWHFGWPNPSSMCYLVTLSWTIPTPTPKKCQILFEWPHNLTNKACVKYNRYFFISLSIIEINCIKFLSFDDKHDPSKEQIVLSNTYPRLGEMKR